MSNVNIRRAVENIKSNTTIFTPIVEVIVNSIQAIESAKILEGEIHVIAKRSPQFENDGSLRSIEGFEIVDNGIGFTEENRNSFDTLYSDYKISLGGKGFGRFTCLKYFNDLKVDSIYHENGYKRRTFSMGKGTQIIVDETVVDCDAVTAITSISLVSVKGSFPHKKLSTVARSLVEMLLPYFITKDYNCPEIRLMEEDKSEFIVLNDYIRDASAIIKEIKIPNGNFVLTGTANSSYTFEVRVFKIYSPKNKVSKISLVADKREVIESPIHTYIPEFNDEFYEKKADGTDNSEKNFILKTYVFGDYLDEHVSLERGGFDFQKEGDVIHGISQCQIESIAAELTSAALGEEISTRKEKKKETIIGYVEEEAPWHKTILKEIDFSKFSYNPSVEEIETKLQQEKFRKEMQIRKEVAVLLTEDDSQHLKESVAKIVERISESSKIDLIHYIASRRKVLELFKKSLELDDHGKYPDEEVVHDIIFPMKADSESVRYDEHNLWIVDERLNFTHYISSDLPLNGGNSERPDVLVFDHRVVFRGENEPSNPVTVFEFKKPGRDDFVNPSSKEDPVQQIIRYVNNIRSGTYKTPEGRKINVAENTPFYGYVVCDLTSKVEKWLMSEKDFKPMPDRLGWFQWYTNINLYMEVISWDKLLKDADLRNKVFFHKLGI